MKLPFNPSETLFLKNGRNATETINGALIVYDFLYGWQ